MKTLSSRLEELRKNGTIIVSPTTGSMKPIIRPKRDQAIFSLAESYSLGNVVLYTREPQQQLAMHRIIAQAEGGFILRGDNATYTEFVPTEQIHGLMIGFYRDASYISCEAKSYKLYVYLWPKLYPLLEHYKTSSHFFWRGVRYIRRKFL